MIKRRCARILRFQIRPATGGDYRLSVCGLGSGRWLLSPAPWSGRNAKPGNPTAIVSPPQSVAPAPAKTPALSARDISWGSSAKSVSAAARKDPFGGDQVSGDNILLSYRCRCVLCICREPQYPHLIQIPCATRPSLSSRNIILQLEALSWECWFLAHKKIHLFHYCRSLL